jgi:hypothetical protein
MKRNIKQKKRVVDNTPRHTRSDHGSNNLYTPPISVGSRNGTSGSSTDGRGDDSALLKRLEKISNEINTMQTYPNQNYPPNQNYHMQFNPQTHFGGPPGNPPSFSSASPRPMEFHMGHDTHQQTPRHMNDMMSNGRNPHTHDVSPQRQLYSQLNQPAGTQYGGTNTNSNHMVRSTDISFSPYLHNPSIPCPLSFFFSFSCRMAPT